MTADCLSRASQLLENAAECLHAGSIDKARTLCAEILKADAKHSGALHLLGFIELRSRNHARAIDLMNRAVAADPSFADAHCHLGDAYLEINSLERARVCYQAAIGANEGHSAAHNSLGVTFARARRTGDAALCFSRALAIEPEWAVPHFNLGLALKEEGSIRVAVKEFRKAWMLDPLTPNSMYECVNAIADWVREDSDFRAPSRANPLLEQHSISVVFCSIDDAKCARTERLYRHLLGSVPHELIPIRDARSLAEAYNRGIAASTGDIVILSHDDVDILAADFAVRLQSLMARFDVVGVMGATQMTGPTWNWSRHPYLRGWITHRESADGKWRVMPVDPHPLGMDVVVLDGVFMAARRNVFEEVTFDEETFDGFHLYDIDWSYRVSEAGYRLATAGDLLLVHASRGRYDDAWRHYAEQFCMKHLGGDLGAPAPLHIAEADLNSAEEVRAFFGRLAELDTQSDQ